MDVSADGDSSGQKFVSVKKYSKVSLTQFSTLIDGSKLSYVQLEAGVFKGDAVIIDLQDVLIRNRKSNLSYFAAGGFPGYIGFSFPYNLDGRYFFNRSSFRPYRQAVISNHNSHNAVYPKNFHEICVMMKIDRLQFYLGKLKSNRLLDTIEHCDFLTVKSHERAKVSRLISVYYDEVLKASKDGVDNKQLAQNFNKKVINLLYEYLVKFTLSEQASDYRSKTANILDRSLRFIFDRSGISTNLEELSLEIFSSKRSVQYAFSEYLEFSHADFSRKVRLNAVRNDLIRMNRGSKSVSDVLLEFQILNSGRYRHEYFDFFGEYPLDTANRKIGERRSNIIS